MKHLKLFEARNPRRNSKMNIVDKIYLHGTEQGNLTTFNLPLFLTPSMINAGYFCLDMRKGEDGKNRCGKILANSVGYVYKLKVNGNAIYKTEDEIILIDGDVEIIEKYKINSHRENFCYRPDFANKIKM